MRSGSPTLPVRAYVGEIARDLRVRIETSDGSASLFERRRRWSAITVALVLALGGPALIAALNARDAIGDADFAAPLLYLLPVVAATLVGGLAPALVAVAASAGAIIYRHLPPSGTGFSVEASRDLLPVGVYLVVALILSHSLSRQRMGRAQLEDVQGRLAFIAHASELLGETALDYRRTVTELARLSVPRLADVCIVDVLDDAGHVRTVVVAHDAAVDAVRADSLLAQPAPDEREAGVTAVIASGRAEIYPRVDDDTLAGIANGPEHLNLLRGLRLRSLMIVPLRSPRSTFGAITLATVATRTRYSPRELTLAEDVAARAGTALENVALYVERSHEAQMLQRTLLPAEIPAIPGAEVVVRFRPQGPTHLVGGDFYDVFQIDDRTYGIAVGDVCGTGIEAAALTGLARHTIRVGAMRERTPARVLEVLNEALLRQGADRYCTAVFATMRLQDDGNASLSIAAGGHPLPILMPARGGIRQVGVPGTLLGVFPDPDVSDVTIVFEPADTLLLYTDGLLDERRPEPEARLADLVASLAGTEPEKLAIMIEEASTRREPPPDDDVAIVVVQMAAERTVRLPAAVSATTFEGHDGHLNS